MFLVGVAIKEPSGEVERTSRETQEEDCEEDAEEPESDADFVWYDEKKSDLRQDRQAKNNHLFSSGESKDKSNLISESIDKSSLKTQSKDAALVPEDQNNFESRAPHSSIRKGNILNPHPLRHIVKEYKYAYDDVDEEGSKKRDAFDAKDSDFFFDCEDQDSVQEKN